MILESFLNVPFLNFSHAYLSGRLPGSVLFAGDRESGVNYVACASAKLFLCSSPQNGHPCGHCKSCSMFDAGTHPDFIAVIGSTKDEADNGLDMQRDPKILFTNEESAVRKSVRIDSMRKLSSWSVESAGAGNKKVAVIADAHTMPEGAANAILKTFEEPPQNTLIIMTARSLESLLPTILSRAYKIVLQKASLHESLNFIKRNCSAEDERAQIALALSGYKPYGALRLIRSDDDIKISHMLKELIDALNGQGNEEQAIDSLLSLDPLTQGNILYELVCEVLKYKAHVNKEDLPLINIFHGEKLAQLSADHLFLALDDLRYIKSENPLIPPRAPKALIRSWIRALKE
ncbi:DNA polymerase III subunit delta' [Succinatimonas hippei]|nr:DNA polymerase III subunit delta' [Succinatimonas hippei]